MSIFCSYLLLGGGMQNIYYVRNVVCTTDIYYFGTASSRRHICFASVFIRNNNNIALLLQYLYRNTPKKNISKYLRPFFAIFQVHQADRMSARICHACISYLNSWQSFKNRCYAAQKRQRSQLETITNNNGGTAHSPIPFGGQAPQKPSPSQVMNQQQILQHAAASQRQRAIQEQRSHMQKQRILKNALMSGSKPKPVLASQQFNAFNAAGIDVVSNVAFVIGRICVFNILTNSHHTAPQHRVSSKTSRLIQMRRHETMDWTMKMILSIRCSFSPMRLKAMRMMTTWIHMRTATIEAVHRF